MNTIEIIKEILDQEQLSPAAFAKKCGLVATQIYDLNSGKIKKISSGVANKIIKAFPHYSLQWVLTGEGDMLNDSSEIEEEVIQSAVVSRKNPYSQMQSHVVPLVPTEALANSLSEYLGAGVRRSDCQNIVSSVPGAELAIRISGDSMLPNFQDGMIVFLKQINEVAFIPWGNTLVLDTVNGAFIKNVFPCEDDDSYVIARSSNPNYPPMRIPKDSIYRMFRILTATKFFTTM